MLIIELAEFSERIAKALVGKLTEEKVVDCALVIEKP